MIAAAYSIAVFIIFVALCTRAARLEERYKSRGPAAHDESFLRAYESRNGAVGLFLVVTMLGAILFNENGWTL
jgi:hypothetical protein